MILKKQSPLLRYTTLSHKETPMKKVLAINGSPRKSCNTATLLKHALDGAAEAGAETELVHLYDLNYKGCISCFACKLKNSKNRCNCALKDELSPVLQRAMQCTAILLGSPIYLGSITGAMQCFFERMFFMNLSYDKPARTNFTGTINVGFIYTMGLPEQTVREFGYEPPIEHRSSRYSAILRGKWENLLVMDTYQFDDYAKYEAGLHSEERKRKVREEQFPIDCSNAKALGKRMAG